MKTLKVISIYFVLLFTFLCIQEPVKADNFPKIWILNSYHYDFKLGLDTINSIKETIYEYVPDASIHVHYMDTMRFTEREAWPLTYRALDVKGKRETPDVIVAMDDSALRFLFKYRKNLFPNVPIVFSGVNEVDPKLFEGLEDQITGVYEDFSFRGTARLILMLHPDIEKVVFIHAATLTGNILHRKAIRELNPIFNKADVAVEYWSSYTFEELAKKLQHLSKINVLIFTGIHRDEKGNFLSSTESEINFIMKYLPEDVPAYSFWDIYEPFIIGGTIFEGRVHGQQVGRMVVSLLRGTPIKKIPIEPPIVHKIFYYNKLLKFGIQENRLPSDAVIRGKPNGSLIVRYWYIFIGVIIFQILLFLSWILVKSKNKVRV